MSHYLRHINPTMPRKNGRSWLNANMRMWHCKCNWSVGILRWLSQAWFLPTVYIREHKRTRIWTPEKNRAIVSKPSTQTLHMTPAKTVVEISRSLGWELDDGLRDAERDKARVVAVSGKYVSQVDGRSEWQFRPHKSAFVLTGLSGQIRQTSDSSDLVKSAARNPFRTLLSNLLLFFGLRRATKCECGG